MEYATLRQQCLDAVTFPENIRGMLEIIFDRVWEALPSQTQTYILENENGIESFRKAFIQNFNATQAALAQAA